MTKQRSASDGGQAIREVVLRRISPLSAAKVAASVDGIFGLLAGAVFTSLSLMGVLLVDPRARVMALMFGVGSVIILPVVYALIGFLTGLIGAWVYNIVAGWVGGLNIELS